MDILIRKATTADLDLVTHIEATCFPPAEAAPREAFKERLDHYAGPVSYTHLDVYKRQLLTYGVYVEAYVKDQIFGTVSYTHLDVYKRQAESTAVQ